MQQSQTTRARMRRGSLVMPCAAIASLCAMAAFPGCASQPDDTPSTQPSSAYDRSQAALNDPFHYSPGENPNISGGGIADFDREGMRKDLDHVLNP